jgi:hypothetical protein
MASVTTFMGCGESPIDDRVTRALSQSFVKLSIQEFIEVSGFKIDAIMLNFLAISNRSRVIFILGGPILGGPSDTV